MLDSSQTSRRAMIGALAIAPALGFSMTSAAAASPSTLEWDSAHAAHLAAVHSYGDHETNVRTPAYAELNRRAPVPDRKFTVPIEGGRSVTLSFDPAEPDLWVNHPSPAFREPAVRAREAWFSFVAAHDAAEADLKLEQIEEESERLHEATIMAEDRLFETPAPHIAAVLVKLDLLWRDERDPIPGFQELVLADIKRLGGN
jgi:hypothetical protein